ncbi:DNA-processing protein DprA [Lacrimispora xylanolytica]|uniref:DNA-processing protein DprA n=1 Tax=Lacrimispora xylanolytica TaxID=29375 RepID=A0ABY7A6J4_9FIRM|nr:DNA-processing protein DprA [Lacrimispora xylanolytica]WAJ22280.1 DNA-processing protein DprA [Lacrimispora xylanolytica]
MVSHEEREYLYWLCHVPMLGAVTIKRLYDYMGSYKEIYNIEGKELQRLGLLKSSAVSAFEDSKKRKTRCDKELYGLKEQGIEFVTSHDAGFPARLFQIYDYPMGIFYKGKLPDKARPTVAVIGARNCTNYGRQMASYLSKELASCGVQIISGLASGIDGAGHLGALEGKGDTYGVLGCGINICYPKENYGLFEQIKERGGILTEFVPDEAPRPCNFPMRNRIISGLSDAILVIEAREKSGSLITANLGLDQGKEIFALPGRVTDPLSAGCNRLISEGAGVILSPDSVLEYFDLQNGKILRVHEKNKNGLAKKEKMVYSCLDLQPKNLEEIVSLSGLSVSECMGALLELEFNGLILQTSHQYYGKKL